MAFAYAIDNALQLPADIADVIVSETEPIAHGFLKVFTPVLSDLLLSHANSARFMSSRRFNSCRSRPPMICITFRRKKYLKIRSLLGSQMHDVSSDNAYTGELLTRRS
jgi:hypothetical protein